VIGKLKSENRGLVVSVSITSSTLVKAKGFCSLLEEMLEEQRRTFSINH
jgi:hypothetical protein